ncbi:hypothetical protein Salat_1429600 [Sesamum alatum]|uniref:Uncharacterized protein n=1 Tax=Sesamum alatum TaxID=300844 RepID=A0AAE1YAF4_9LAMI|nr:hypothetical protein Salat_1429600 [Sesamum alatum]
MGGGSTSDWTSSGNSGPDSPSHVSRVLPQKIRGKMPRSTRVSSSSEPASPVSVMASSEAMAVISGTPTNMTEESIRKLVTQIALPDTYDWVFLSVSDAASDPPPGFLTVYSAQLLSGLRFPLPPLMVEIFNLLGIPPPSQLLPNSYRLVVGFLLCSQLYGFSPSVENFLGVLAPKITIGECFFYLSPRPGLTFLTEKPSSLGTWKSRFFFVRKPEWNIPTAWAWSLNALPPLNFGHIKRVMKEAGLVDHEFNAKKILEEELLLVAGLHPAPDRYEGPLDRLTRFRIMMNRAAVRKFISDDVPAMPSSSRTRSAPSTPSDLPPELTSPPMTTPPPSSVPCPQETPVTEVVTSPEDVPSMTPPTGLPQDVHLSSLLPPPVEDLPPSHKRPD